MAKMTLTEQAQISIHAPLTGCDRMTLHQIISVTYFNPRTPYGMRRYKCFAIDDYARFQSTHPLRDATQIVQIEQSQLLYFNPRTPYGMRRTAVHCYIMYTRYFNPRTPYGMRRVEREITKGVIQDFNPRTPYGMRLSIYICNRNPPRFQSTHPLRDATNCFFEYLYMQSEISIHAPLTGCDVAPALYISPALSNFNPRTPYGMRLSCML